MFIINWKEREAYSNFGFSGGVSGKEHTCQHTGDIRDSGSVPGSGRFPLEEQIATTAVFLLGNPVDKGAWQATVHGVAESST